MTDGTAARPAPSGPSPSALPVAASPTAAPAAPAPAAPSHTLTGDFRTHEHFHSRHLQRDRTVLVHLPPGYGTTPDRRYPVMYLHDGQNIFDKATSVGEEWRVDETADALVAAGRITPAIIVGIYNAGDARLAEYTPTRDAVKGGGLADRHGRMLVEELKPFIDSEYRTLPGANDTGLGGSSLGGLLALHLALAHPGVFTRIAALSPSIWWDERVIVRAVEALPARLPLRIWLDAGTSEGAETLANARALRDALIAHGWRLGEDLSYLEAAGGEHNEQSWAARVAPMLEFLFPPAGAGRRGAR